MNWQRTETMIDGNRIADSKLPAVSVMSDHVRAQRAHTIFELEFPNEHAHQRPGVGVKGAASPELHAHVRGHEYDGDLHAKAGDHQQQISVPN